MNTLSREKQIVGLTEQFIESLSEYSNSYEY